MDIIISSNNEGKIKEFKKIFSEYDFNIYSLNDINYIKEIDEIGQTFEQNALIKAQQILRDYPDHIVIGDDSGIMVEALEGEPGVYSARYGSDYPGYEEDNDLINNEKLLDILEGVENRKAQMVTVLCVCINGQEPIFVRGSIKGDIAAQPRGENGFGYDPIFSTNGIKTQAEKKVEEKNIDSQRAQAFNKLIELDIWNKL